MNRRLIIDGTAVYEVDETCMLKRRIGEDEQKREAEQNDYMEEYKKGLRRTEA